MRTHEGLGIAAFKGGRRRLGINSFGATAVHYWTMRGVEDTTIESLPSQVSGDTATLNAVGTGDITTTTVNSKKVAVTNGSSNALQAMTTFANGLNSDTRWTVVFVGKRSDLADFLSIWTVSDNSKASSMSLRGLMYNNTSTQVFLRSLGSNFLSWSQAERAPYIDDILVGVTTWDGSKVCAYVNGQKIFDSSDTKYTYSGAGSYASQTNDVNNITFGALSRNSPGSLELYRSIQFGECIIYRSALSQANVYRLSKFLAPYWGIQVHSLAEFGWVRHDFTIAGAPLGDLTSIASTSTDSDALVPASPEAWFETPTIDEPGVLNMYGDKSAQVSSTACSNGETFTAVSVLRTVAADSYSYGRVLALSGTGAASGNSELSITMNPLGTAPNDLAVYDGLTTSPSVTVDLSDYHVLALEYDNQTSNIYLDGIKILSFDSASPRDYTSQKWILGNFDAYGSSRRASIYAKSFALIRGKVDQVKLAKQLQNDHR